MNVRRHKGRERAKMTFSNLGLSAKALDAITAAGFQQPTPIQSQAIPAVVRGRDVVGIAQTGTGKTASFVLPMLTRLEKGRARARMPRSLIMEPTRELAAQVAQAFEQLGANHKLTVALLIGGVSFDEQDRKLDRGADVLIATPGRLLDHFGRGKLLLSAVEIVVIDEGDRMLDMGFIPDIERICKLLPLSRQTLFFSATMPSEIQKLADKFLSNPERIAVAPQASTANTITQKLKFAPTDAKLKREVLRDLIRGGDVKNAIIFCNRKRDVGILLKSLRKHGFNAGGLHGDMEQRERMATLDAFRRGDIAFLAASDVAARGLDIPDVSHVYNFDVPVSPEDYVHRVGRTGRAGREGYAATLVTASDLDQVKAIEKLCKQKIEWLDGEPSAETIEEERKAARSARRGRAQGRPAREEAPRGRSRRAPREETPQAEKKPARTRSRRAKEPAPAEVAEQAAIPAEDTRPATKEAAGERRPRRERRKEEAAVIGLGDHVPAFLMTPIRRSKPSA